MGKRYAILIANWNYRDPKFPKLSSGLQDIAGMEEVLKSRDIGQFDEVSTVTNGGKSDICESLELFVKNRSEDDTLLIYFSGHGIRDASGNFYLAASDTKREVQSSGVDARFIREQLNERTCKRKMLLLDCCFAGAFLSGFQQKAATHYTAEDVIGSEQAFRSDLGLYIITATDSLTPAYERDASTRKPGDMSIFTKHVVDGLRTGAAARNNTGVISADDLYTYVEAKVVAEITDQKPDRMSLHNAGNLMVARQSQRPASSDFSAADDSNEARRTNNPTADILVLKRRLADAEHTVAQESERRSKAERSERAAEKRASNALQRSGEIAAELDRTNTRLRSCELRADDVEKACQAAVERAKAEKQAAAASLKEESNGRNAAERAREAAEQALTAEAQLRAQTERERDNALERVHLQAQQLAETERSRKDSVNLAANEAERRAFFERQCSALEKSAKDGAHQLASLQRTRAAAEEEIASLSKLNKDVEQQRDALKNRVTGLEQQIYDAQREQAAEARVRTDAEKQRDALNKLVAETAQQLSNEQRKRTAAETRADNEATNRALSETQRAALQERIIEITEQTAEAKRALELSESLITAEARRREESEKQWKAAESRAAAESLHRIAAENARQAADSNAKDQAHWRDEAERALAYTRSKFEEEAAQRFKAEKERESLRAQMSDLAKELGAEQDLQSMQAKKTMIYRSTAIGLSLACGMITAVFLLLAYSKHDDPKSEASLSSSVPASSSFSGSPSEQLPRNAEPPPAVEPKTADCASECVDRMIRVAFDEKKAREIEQAIAAMPKPARGDQNRARKFNDDGLSLLKANQPKDALDQFESARSADPLNAEYPANICVAQNQLGQYNDAIKACVNAILLMPDRTTSWTPLADAFAFRNEADRAVRALWVAWVFSANRDKTVQYYVRCSLGQNPTVVDPKLIATYKAAVEKLAQLTNTNSGS